MRRPPATLVKSLPNAITVLRLFLVPAVVGLLLDGQGAAAFWVFIAAGLFDAVDGALARLLDARSELGAWLDPLADKALLGATCLTMGATGLLPAWLVIIILFRDLLIIAGVLLLRIMGTAVTIRPLAVSKVNTAVQIALVGVVLAEPALGLPTAVVVPAMVWLTVATTVASAAGYVYVWARQMLAPPAK
ncbi:CDP-alcohol phosphatidyltransferase family protein [Novispirillum sp. DQ9]|uniref:CDP-alcohol phosphatidyltransferase family protein n=1 Tax=Novispirillum sp. DQ9 TaxID=3398612 RepID=UPI003C7B636F